MDRRRRAEDGDFQADPVSQDPHQGGSVERSEGARGASDEKKGGEAVQETHGSSRDSSVPCVFVKIRFCVATVGLESRSCRVTLAQLPPSEDSDGPGYFASKFHSVGLALQAAQPLPPTRLFPHGIGGTAIEARS